MVAAAVAVAVVVSPSGVQLLVAVAEKMHKKMMSAGLQCLPLQVQDLTVHGEMVMKSQTDCPHLPQEGEYVRSYLTTK